MAKQYDFKIIFDKLNEHAQANPSENQELVKQSSEIQALQKIIAEISEADEAAGTFTRA